jgi:hypothetical protein
MEALAMSDLEIATAQLESWIDNKTQVGVVFKNGFAVGPTEYGTLDQGFIFRNPILTVSFKPSIASAVLWQDGVYQIRFKYPCGLLSFYERKATNELGKEVEAEEGPQS